MSRSIERLRLRAGLVVLGLAPIACGGPAPAAPLVVAPMAVPSSSSAAPPLDARAQPKKSYPPRYPVVAEPELARKTDELARRSPGWDIELDPFGFLSGATCRVCGRPAPKPAPAPNGASGTSRSSAAHGGPLGEPFTQDDLARVKAFLDANEDVLFLTGPDVVRTIDTPSRAFYQQRTSVGIASFVSVDRDADGSIRVGGHMWPGLPVPLVEAGAPIDGATEAKLRALDSSAGLEVKRDYQSVAFADDGPFEVREAVCLFSPADEIAKRRPNAPRPKSRPCLDARTGEDLTKVKAGWTITTDDGRVTSRHITR